METGLFLEHLTKRSFEMTGGDQGSGEREEGAMHIAVAFITHAEAAKLMQPADRAFHHPTVAPQAAAVLGVAFGKERLNAFGAQAVAKGGAIVGPIGEQTDDLGAQPGRQPDQQREKIAGVVVIGGRDGSNQRNPRRVGQEVVFASGLRPVDWIRTRLGPPKTARTLLESTATRDQSILPSRSRRSIKRICNRSHTPAASQARIRRQHDMPLPQPNSCGKSSQPMPVFRTKMIPVSARRSSIGLRPGYRRRLGLRAGNSGAISCHSSSSTSGLAIPIFHHSTSRGYSSFFILLDALKLSGPARDAALKEKNALLWDPSGKGRPMKEWVAISGKTKFDEAGYAKAAYDYVSKPKA